MAEQRGFARGAKDAEARSSDGRAAAALRELQERVSEFERTSGLSLSPWFTPMDATTLKRARAIHEGTAGDVERIAARLRTLADGLVTEVETLKAVREHLDAEAAKAEGLDSVGPAA